ncbi:hypothetical protein [Sphingomonas sp.]|uniref:hypothetical protein n=1 Tax=Sphingomonas sp. TaxID=28214 RepID=UPI003CC5B629
MTSFPKPASKLIVAALLAGGATLALAVPAAGRDRQQPAANAPPQLHLSPAALAAARPAQAAVQANNPAAAEPLVAALEAASTLDGDKYVAALLRYQLESQKAHAAQVANPRATVDEASQAAPLDSLIANPATPAADRGKYAARRGEIAYAVRQYPQAIQFFTQARTLGFTDANLDLAIVKAKIDSGDVAGGTAELEHIIAASTARGERAPVEYYRYAIGRSNKAHLTQQTVAWMNRYAAAYPVGQTWYEVLVTYGFQQDATARLDNPQKIDLFRLMRATGGLADQYFYIEYAQKAQNAGLPLEAQAVLREGLANGKIPAANTEARAMQVELTRAIAAEGSLVRLETQANAAANGQLAGQTGDAYLSTGNYAKAATLYRTALTKGSVDADTINTRLGIALARSGDKAGALAAFAAVHGSPRADIASFWTTYLNAPAAAATPAAPAAPSPAPAGN